MKLSFSNIGWPAECDERMYAALAERGFTGLEIAPTRFVGDDPYNKNAEASEKAVALREKHGLEICSMQSIWYGKTEAICAGERERAELIDYTRAALDFARAAGCPNLVFGCPKNRRIEKDGDERALFEFFKEMCAMAAKSGAKIAIEANPPLYGTNFLNDTRSACEFARALGEGAAVNLDFGTIIANGENLDEIGNELGVISHVHISEPNLAPIERRPEHRALADILRAGGYEGYVSVEMRAQPFERALEAADWLAEAFA